MEAQKNEKFYISLGDNGDNALAVIDMQKDFAYPEGALFVGGVHGEPTSDEVVKRVNALIADYPFDWVALSRDRHPDNHIEFSIFGKHCLMMTDGADFATELVRPKGDWEVVDKGHDKDVFSYSVVTSGVFPGHIRNLRAKGIKRVFVCGLAYTHCVGESAIAYACQGFETYVIRDATRSVPPPYGNPESMDRKLELYGVKLITVADIIK